MIIKVFFTEVRRSLQDSIAVFIFSLMLGFVVSFVVLLSSHLRQVFDSPAWNADLVILPKGVTPEGAIQSVLVGKPAALIPHALFETLSQQSRGSSVKLLGFIPFEDENSKIGVAFTDPDLKDFPLLQKNSLWSQVMVRSLIDQRGNSKPPEDFQTAEWGNQVLLGVLVRGNPVELGKLKTLIDRRTVAQAFLLDDLSGEGPKKFRILQRGMYSVTFLVLVLAFLGLLSTRKNLKSQSDGIGIVLKELGWNEQRILKIKFLQFLCLVLIPLMVGSLLSPLGLSMAIQILFV